LVEVASALVVSVLVEEAFVVVGSALVEEAFVVVGSPLVEVGVAEVFSVELVSAPPSLPTATAVAEVAVASVLVAISLLLVVRGLQLRRRTVRFFGSVDLAIGTWWCTTGDALRAAKA